MANCDWIHEKKIVRSQVCGTDPYEVHDITSKYSDCFRGGIPAAKHLKLTFTGYHQPNKYCTKIGNVVVTMATMETSVLRSESVSRQDSCRFLLTFHVERQARMAIMSK